MRQCLIATTLFAAACTSAAPPTAVAQPHPAQPATGAAPVEPGARALARTLFADLARKLEARAERIVEVEERRHALGGMLAGYDLFEAPRGSAFPGLCEVTVHRINVAFHPPRAPEAGPAPVEPESESIVTRYHAIGSTMAGSGQADARDSCASLPTARAFFDAASPQKAEQAVQMLEWAQLWSRTTPAAVSIRCADDQRRCADTGAFLRALDRGNIVTIADTPCAADMPGRGAGCVVYRIDQSSGLASGRWQLTIRGPERPLQVDIRELQMPVS